MRILTTLALIFATGSVAAQPNSLLAESSLTEAEAILAAQPDKSPNDQFTYGAVLFLRGIEKSLQFRWQHNMAIKDFDLPVLRLPVPPNPDAQPFSPELITVLFANLRDDMAVSQAALEAVSGEVSVKIDLMTLWFDINMNGVQDEGEGLIEFGINTTMSPRQARDMLAQTNPALTVQFDTADVAWLNAYTHLLSGLSELVIAFDPTEAITKVLSSNQAMMALRGNTSAPNILDALIGGNAGGFGGWVDQFAMVYGALNQQPIAENTRAAHGHFLAMIEQNKVFWAAVATETDNTLEWIPNATQTAALGFTLPEGAAEAWQAILGDAEQMLRGELLVSYWRIAPAGGVNIQKLFENPPAVDIVDWFQGAGLLPYLERGPTLSARNFRQFERMLLGDTLLFALLFN
ncbi:MAG: hypothetical protein COB08_012340 [Rhodobacteraceae bacterium]|nr:hypothetical protein [Paracoccaceae bacterium]